MADPKIAIALTLQHEGGFVDNPNDPGGATNMGIEQRDVPNIPIKTLTVEQAVEYYREHYWKPLYSDISTQLLASKLFDMGVLFGIGTAVAQLQAALHTAVDGIFGPETLLAVNEQNSLSLLAEFELRMRAKATAIVAANPAEERFIVGWFTRIAS